MMPQAPLPFKDQDIARIEHALRGLRPHLHPQVPNPAPLGLIGFGFTTCLLQVRTTQLGGSTVEDADGVDLILLGFAMFFGGLLQLLAGLGEIRRNNLFGYTAFCLYGCFWMSISVIDIVRFLAAGEAVTNPQAMQTVLALLCIVSVMLWVLTFRLNMTLCSLFFLLATTCALLAAGVENEVVNTVGGYFGMAASANAFWLAFAELVNDVYGGGNEEILPLGHWNRNPFRSHGGIHFPGRIFAPRPRDALHRVDKSSDLHGKCQRQTSEVDEYETA